MARFEGKVAIVTGGASGIGAATLQRLASEGASVVCADIDEEKGEETVAGIASAGGAARFQRCDVAELAQLEECVAVAVRELGGLDIMMNNAVWSTGGWVHQIDPEGWDLRRGGAQARAAFDRTITDAEGARAELVRLTKRARRLAADRST